MKIIKDLIPISAKRSGAKLVPRSITIHNTANERSTAKNERDWLVNPENTRVASWHYAIFQDQIVQAIPDNEIAYHTGSRVGNETSIGIEVTESGDYSLTYKTTVEFVALKLKEYNLSIKDIKKHQDWSGKYCPRLLLPVWDQFIKDIENQLKWNEDIIIDHWSEKHYQSLISKGIVIHEKRFDDPITRGEIFALLDRIVK